MNNDRHDGRFMLGFFIGGLLGALIIFFLGTKEGKVAERIVRKKGKEVMDDLEDKVEDLEEKSKELVEQGEAIKDQVVEQMKDTAHTLTQDATTRLGKTLEKLEDVQRGSLETTAKVRRHFVNLPKKK